MAYASRTGTRRNLAALARAGWRLMVSARGVLRHEGFPYALDNGAYTAWQRGEPFDVQSFEFALDALGEDADFVVAPDIVAAGIDSLNLTREWLPRLGWCRRVLIAVQDGMTPDDLLELVSDRVGIFVGGSTEWKEATIPLWGRFCREAHCYLHVGRVNTTRRIRICADAGADSFDGSSASRYAKTLDPLDRARRQLSLLGGM